MESKQLKYLCREQDLEVSTFCWVFSSLRPCTRYILLSTTLLQLDSWTNIFQGSIINCADTKTHWTGWISFHLFANWQNVMFFFCSSSMKLLSIFPSAVLQITVCPDIQEEGGFKARYRLICQLPPRAPRRWDTGCSSLGRWHQGEFSSLWAGKVPYLLTKEMETKHIFPRHYARIEINWFEILASIALDFNGLF